MDAGSALAEEIRVELGRIGDPVRALGQQRYMKSEMPYRGVTTSQHQALMRDLLRRESFALPTSDAWERTILDLYDNAAFREERYAALGVARHRPYSSWASRMESLPLYEHLIRVGAWWDLVDSTSPLVGMVLRAHPEAAAAVLRLWAHDDSVWVRR
ncbi:MAG TPA: DNA alkylation repair protein, partial [Propionibacteriaceae bacterium]|nr:DNA alkylation repair protein [Propionibacteriaceae bacterium]